MIGDRWAEYDVLTVLSPGHPLIAEGDAALQAIADSLFDATPDDEIPSIADVEEAGQEGDPACIGVWVEWDSDEVTAMPANGATEDDVLAAAMQAAIHPHSTLEPEEEES